MPRLLVGVLLVSALVLGALAMLSFVQKGGEALEYRDIRSVTFYVFPFDQGAYLRELESALPEIKATGFNTIWIVNPWLSFNPEPLSAPPVYNDSRFRHLEDVLTLLREHDMHAILGLNYLGKGWAPEGIDPGRWVTDPEMYGAFEVYVGEFLRRIEGFSQDVFILLFTEGTEPDYLDPYADAVEIARILRQTLGSLPERLDPAIRRKFRFGYHDYSLINLGWAAGRSPLRSPEAYDFLSMVFYGWEERGDDEIAEEMATRAERFRTLHPDVPLILGEMGASICEFGEENQARVITAKASSSVSLGLGFNVWHWRPIPDEDLCENAAFRGLAITSEDGAPKPAVGALRDFIGE